jgi:hypothetical protein
MRIVTMPQAKRHIVFWLAMIQSAAVVGAFFVCAADLSPLLGWMFGAIITGIAAYCAWARFATSWGARPKGIFSVDPPEGP